jgi:hypothetical protein
MTMILKRKYGKQLLAYMLPLAQLAFLAAVLVGRMNNPAFDFFEGALMGFAAVGNLAYLISYRKITQSLEN